MIRLPGDQVMIHDGGVFINDARLPEPYLSIITECFFSCSITLGANEYFFMVKTQYRKKHAVTQPRPARKRAG